MPFLISADRNVNNVPTEPSPQHDLTNVSQNPIENINNPNSPSFRIEENANGNREFNLNLLTETIKCEEIISNSTAILIHFLVFSVVFGIQQFPMPTMHHNLPFGSYFVVGQKEFQWKETLLFRKEMIL